MSREISDLDPSVIRPAQQALDDLRDRDVLHAVTSTRRTADEQIALYAQGPGRASLEIVNLLRKHAGMGMIAPGENTYQVTNCDGVNTFSNHQKGLALDVVPLETSGRAVWPPATDSRWEQIAVSFEAAGFKWGGRWAKPDRPHYEFV